MTARRSRWALGGAATLFWVATIGAATIELQLKMFLVLWLATLLVSLWALAVWLMRGNHPGLSQARLKFDAMRLNEALREESEARHGKRWDRRINNVA